MEINYQSYTHMPYKEILALPKIKNIQWENGTS